MVDVNLILDGDGALDDVDPATMREGRFERIIALDSGMNTGLPSVTIVILMPDGTRVIAQTSGRIFCVAGRAIAARFPDIGDPSIP